MSSAGILTSWAGTGEPGDAYHPVIADTYPVTLTDESAQPTTAMVTDPNLACVKVEADDAVLDEIEADPAFEVVWRE